MSALPLNRLKCTRTVVIDLLFMRQYSLTQTQMQVMYYLLLLKNWVFYKQNDSYIILSSKIENDLKLNPKTVEASLTKLKQLNLIETTRFKVDKWNENRTYRGVKITTLGKEYNLSHYKESDYQKGLELEKENERFRVENDEVQVLNTQLDSENRALKIQNQSLNIQQESDQKLAKDAIKALEDKRKLEEELLAKEIEIMHLKEQLSMVEQKEETPKEQIEKEKKLEVFIKKTTKKHAQTGEEICNGVKNEDNWANETTFYINSYNRLSIYLPSGELKQISEPKKISNFWKWLFNHQHRIGNLINPKKVADISPLEPYLNSTLFFNDEFYEIYSLEAVISGVKVVLQNTNTANLLDLSNGFGNRVIDVEKFKNWIEQCVLKSAIIKQFKKRAKR